MDAPLLQHLAGVGIDEADERFNGRLSELIKPTDAGSLLGLPNAQREHLTSRAPNFPDHPSFWGEDVCGFGDLDADDRHATGEDRWDFQPYLDLRANRSNRLSLQQGDHRLLQAQPTVYESP